MKKFLASATIAAALSVGAAAAASAMPAQPYVVQHVQPFETVHYAKKYRLLPTPVIVNSLHQRGYSHIRNIRIVRGDYIVDARGFRGNQVRLVVDGRTARILHREMLWSDWQYKGNKPHRPPFGMY